MGKLKLHIAFLALVGLAGVIIGLLFFSGETKDGTIPEPAAAGGTSAGLGITYLPITQGLAVYYSLGISYGDLVTGVTPGSSADLAGLKAGDVILSFNGTKLDEQVPLLGMIISCPDDDAVTLEVWRSGSTMAVNLLPAD